MSSSKDDVLQFLDSLGTAPTDGSSSASATTSGSNPAAPADGSSRDGIASSASGTTGTQQDEQSVLDFLDEITQSASASTAATPGATADKVSSPGSQGKTSLYDASAALPSRYLQQSAQQQQQQQPQVDSRASWLGSLWSTASEAVKTTQTAVQSSVKATMESQATKNLEERVKGFVNAESIGKIGMEPKSQL